MVFQGMQSAVRMLTNTLRASFGEIIALGQQDNLRRAYAEYEYLIYLITVWFYTCAAVLLLPFVKVYTHGITDADYIRPELGACFVVVGIVRQIQTPCSTIVGAAGKFREIRGNSITVALLSVSLGCLGAYFWGLEGVLLGLAIAAFLKTGFIIYYGHRHILDESILRSLCRIGRNFVFGVAAGLPFVLWVPVHATTLSQWFACATGVFLWVGFVLILGNVIMERSTSVALVERAKTLLRRQITTSARKSHS